MPLVRKRRVPQQEEEEEEAGDDVSQTEPAPSTQRRRASPPSSNGDEDGEEYGTPQDDSTSFEQMVKKLVRLALSCEYSRTPIRRADISAKVLGTQSRQFKLVFEEAQMRLRMIFGMEMTELPMREKVTIQQMRAAQKSENKATSSNTWVVTSTLPEKFRIPGILEPSRAPTAAQESAYVAIYTFIVSIIALSGGVLPETKYERHLKRVNADQNTPIGRTEKITQRMVKDGYIVKLRDTSSGEEVIEYMVGPRGKVEIGVDGVKGLVKTVYGDDAPEDLDKRLERSLGFAEKDAAVVNGNGSGTTVAAASSRGRGRPRRNAAADDEEDSAEDED